MTRPRLRTFWDKYMIKLIHYIFTKYHKARFKTNKTSIVNPQGSPQDTIWLEKIPFNCMSSPFQGCWAILQVRRDQIMALKVEHNMVLWATKHRLNTPWDNLRIKLILHILTEHHEARFNSLILYNQHGKANFKILRPRLRHLHYIATWYFYQIVSMIAQTNKIPAVNQEASSQDL